MMRFLSILTNWGTNCKRQGYTVYMSHIHITHATHVHINTPQIKTKPATAGDGSHDFQYQLWQSYVWTFVIKIFIVHQVNPLSQLTSLGVSPATDCLIFEYCCLCFHDAPDLLHDITQKLSWRCLMICNKITVQVITKDKYWTLSWLPDPISKFQTDILWQNWYIMSAKT